MRSNRELLKKIFTKINSLSYILPDTLPDIDLYMDQVTTFMDLHLSGNKRYESDKALTKTMINNYAKNRLLPPPIKKKYSKEHMLLLIFIYYYKNFLSFADIEAIFKPITGRHFTKCNKSAIDLSDIYAEVLELNKADIWYLQKDIYRKYARAGKTFTSASKKEREYLILFSFICELAFDIYVKKQIIEQISDHLMKQQ